METLEDFFTDGRHQARLFVDYMLVRCENDDYNRNSDLPEGEEPPEELIVAAQAFLKWFGTWNGPNFKKKLPYAQHLCLTGMNNTQVGPCEPTTMHVPEDVIKPIRDTMRYPKQNNYPKMRKTTGRFFLDYMNE